MSALERYQVLLVSLLLSIFYVSIAHAILASAPLHKLVAESDLIIIGTVTKGLREAVEENKLFIFDTTSKEFSLRKGRRKEGEMKGHISSIEVKKVLLKDEKVEKEEKIENILSFQKWLYREGPSYSKDETYLFFLKRIEVNDEFVNKLNLQTTLFYEPVCPNRAGTVIRSSASSYAECVQATEEFVRIKKIESDSERINAWKEALKSENKTLSSSAQVELEATNKIIIDYPNGGEITSFLRFIREKLGPAVSILPGPDVTGRIKPIYLKATPEVILDRILKVNGFSYDWDKTNNIIEIYKTKDEREIREMTSQAFKPRYITAKSLELKLLDLKSPKGKIIIEEMMNVVFVTDYLSNVDSMKQLVKALDLRTSGIITTKIFIVKYQTPKKIAKGLKKLKSKKGKIIPNNEAMTITVIDYLNIIDSMQKYIESVDAKRLVTRHFQLNYAKAKDLEDILRLLLSKSGKLVIDERTNTVIITDMPQYIENIGKEIEQED